jgi:DNA-binding PadR family transcriptional regulator
MGSVPRLNETELLILSALASQELYGLQIVDEVASMTKGKRKISLGGLYTTLHRMEAKKLVAGRWGETSAERHEARRRYYKITGLGQRAMHEARLVLGSALGFVPAIAGRA